MTRDRADGEAVRRIGYCQALLQHLPFFLTVRNAIDPVEMFTAFLVLVVAATHPVSGKFLSLRRLHFAEVAPRTRDLNRNRPMNPD